ncbi:MAG: hypothetical protein AABW63_00090 [Nanoarchaeota archaeon]
MRGENIILAAFGLLFLFAVMMLFVTQSKITGYATTAQTTSNVTISVYFAIAMSENLTSGITFGNISSLPFTNANSSHNYDGVNTTAQGLYNNATNGTSTWLNVSTDSNTAVDFCVKGDAALTSGANTIGIGNETYANHTVTNVTLPALGSETALTLAYVKAGPAIAAGSSNYYRFWLDVPAGTASGTYNNTLSFEGVSTGGGC